MKEAKLTIRISQDVLDGAKRYARENQTTLTRLVTSHLERLDRQADLLRSAPVTQRLAGILPADASLGECRDHLELKHA